MRLILVTPVLMTSLVAGGATYQSSLPEEIPIGVQGSAIAPPHQDRASFTPP
jgi:hypothetical protein